MEAMIDYWPVFLCCAWPLLLWLAWALGAAGAAADRARDRQIARMIGDKKIKGEGGSNL